jgi:hypothetical protein
MLVGGTKGLWQVDNGCPKDRKLIMESSWNDVSIAYDLR